MSLILNSEKLQAQYDKGIEVQKMRLIKKITPSLQSFCDKWGLGFLAGNGGWTVTFPSGAIVGHPFPNRYRGSVESDGRWLMDHFSPDISEALGVDAGRCCIGCQMEVYEQKNDFKYKYFHVEEFINPPEFIVKLADSPCTTEGIDTYGPVSESLADAIYEEYKKDIKLGEELIVGCLPRFTGVL
jgi:hypothetical protein